MQHWYVYYKLARSDRAAVVARVREMQRCLAEGNPVRVRLLERCEDASDTTTVMEVYEDIGEPARFATALEEAVRASGLDVDQAGGRRIERRIERFKDT